MTKVRRLLIGLLTATSLATPSVADLLDEETEPSVQPEPKVEPPSPTPPPKSVNVPSKSGKDAKTSPSPQASPGTTSSTPDQQVLAPKNPGKKVAKKDKEPVHFESKGLKGLREKGTVELIDDVVVTQAAFRLEADHAQVFFDETTKDVVKVIADGNVKIFNVDENTGEKLKAYGDQVLFLNKDRVVIMHGNARLWRGEDSMIRGKKITYEMDTGWIRADRVAGELNPSEKDQKK